GILVVAVAFFARLQIGGQRLAAFFHHAGDIAGELLRVGGAAFDRFRWGSHGDASIAVRRGPAGGLNWLQMDFSHYCCKTHQGGLVRHVDAVAQGSGRDGDLTFLWSYWEGTAGRQFLEFAVILLGGERAVGGSLRSGQN